MLVKGGENELRGDFTLIASTEQRDLDGELIIQKGLEWGLFEKRGWFNEEHKGGYEFAIGEPTDVQACMHKGVPATRVEGFLYLDDPLGKKAYNKAKMLQKSSDTRRLGGSIEGPVIERDPIDRTIVRRALVTNVAITCYGKAPDTEMIVKACKHLGVSDELLAQMLLKSDGAGAGYQTPAGTEGGDAGNYAPIIPQSIDSRVAVADIDLWELVNTCFPGMTDEETLRTMSLFS
tara:strand:- start:1964 stop:2665 length:702 start_codon:yes stop_codon:yes gene_type:complete